uniref:LicD family protein n=1 Tax=Globisporangium ultimum (strain ATCC 200006 / CBS 805.95 / DAOM BR144) TaxID=431595 RepID=K3XBE8_GLOUD
MGVSNAARPGAWFLRLLLLLLVSLCVLAAASIIFTTSTLSVKQMLRRNFRSSRSSRNPPPKRLNVSLSSSPELVSLATTCSPETLDAGAIHFHASQVSEATRHFYTKLQALNQPPAPPMFTDDHAFLCEEILAKREQWAYCLPISARRDEPFCVNASREQLLDSLPSLPHNQLYCYASVLHLILVDVYEELRVLGGKPALLYGTLLGAVRNKSVIPFTEDADIGYQLTGKFLLDDLKDALWRKGLHMFHYGIPRVCISPIHPLASRLYNPHKSLGTEYTVPYVDMYKMRKHMFTLKWDIEQTKNGRKLADAQVQPYSKVELLGEMYDTLADPTGFLRIEYGENHMVPESYLWWW